LQHGGVAAPGSSGVIVHRRRHPHQVPITLEERLAEAREIIDIQLDDLMETREQLSQAK